MPSMTELARLTQDVPTMRANREILESSYCPDCDMEPGRVWGVATIGSVIFVIMVGVTVGTDVTLASFSLAAKQSKRPFCVGLLCQFVCMPLYAFVLTYIFKDDMTETAKHSYEASVLGLMIVGSLPGGTTSNLFTWLVGGNVSLSILMSLVSNVAALGSMPLLLYIFFELRFDDIPDKPVIPYRDIVIPLGLMILGVGSGMVVRAKGSSDLIWWTAKVSSIFAIVFLFLAVVMGLIKNPHLLNDGYSLWISCLSMQPAGYLMGWLLASLAKCSLRDKMTIAFETGVQSFALGLVVPELSFNAEKEACQFASSCMALITGDDTDRYLFSWDADGRIKEGEGVGQITSQGFLPGEAGSRSLGGCCRYNEMIYLDALKYSAICALLYALHAFWMILMFRKIFPNGRQRFREDIEEAQFPDNCRPELTTGADQEVPPVFATTPLGIATADQMPPMTVVELLEIAATKCPNELALCTEILDGPCPKEHKMEATKSKPLRTWSRWTWSQYKADIDNAARAFIDLGVQHFGSVTIFGFNSPHWNISALAAMCAGAKAVGIYPTDTVEQVVYKTQHSGAAVAVVEDSKKLERYRDQLDNMPDLKAIVVYMEAPASDTLKSNAGSDVPILSWQQFTDRGRFPAAESDKELKSRRSSIKPGHACCLVYTSGTTGMPKAVMLSHDNLICTGLGVLYPLKHSFGVEYTQERSLSYLPLSHVAGFQLDIVFPVVFTALKRGFWTVFFARSYDLKEGTLKNRLTFARPTIFFGVPRVWEKFHEGLMEVSRKTAEMKGCRAMMPIFCCVRKSTAARWAKRHGLLSMREMQYGYSGRTTALYGLADAMVLSQIKPALGLDACKYFATGAAPIARETLEYFGSIGIQVNELYGMSESSAATTLSTDERHIWGSCGFSLPGTQVKIFKAVTPGTKQECPPAADIFQPTEEEQGEICFRGRTIMMGYYANSKLGPEHVEEINSKTRESIDTDGWLHSGDKGCKDANGMIRVTGRYKELIITAGGENVAPVPIEDCIKENCPAISNIMMVGDKRKYNVCLVTLKAQGATGELAGTEQLAGSALTIVPGIATTRAANSSDEYRKVINEAIQAANNNSKVCPSQASRIQKFEILLLDFSADGGEFTPTLKLKRKFTEEKYKSIIDGMYN